MKIRTFVGKQGLSVAKIIFLVWKNGFPICCDTFWCYLTNSEHLSLSALQITYGQKKMLTQIEREKIGVWFSYEANVCSYQTLHTVDLIQILVRHQRQVTKSLHAQKAISQHTTTTHHTTSKKQRHHDLPHLPASSGFTCKGECNRRTVRCVIVHDLCNTAMHFLNVKLIIPLFYWLFFCWPLTSAIVDKR